MESALLQREGRVSYRALKLRFDMNDDYIEGIKDELIYAKKLAMDEDNRVLVWTGDQESFPPPLVLSPSEPPVPPPDNEREHYLCSTTSGWSSIRMATMTRVPISVHRHVPLPVMNSQPIKKSAWFMPVGVKSLMLIITPQHGVNKRLIAFALGGAKPRQHILV
jgi:hypothetical protein